MCYYFIYFSISLIFNTVISIEKKIDMLNGHKLLIGNSDKTCWYKMDILFEKNPGGVLITVFIIIANNIYNDSLFFF